MAHDPMYDTFTNLGAAIRLDRGETDTITDLGGPEALTLTFAQYDRRTGRLAKKLAEQYEPGSTIGILGENSIPWFVLFSAVLRAGLVAVPLSHRAPAEITEYIVADAALAHIYVDEAHRGGLSADAGPAVSDIADAWDLSNTDGEALTATVAPEDPAMFLYTSGSTGKPKGVVLSHSSHLWVVSRGIEGDSRDSRLLISAPLYHMGALSPLQRALGAGQSIVLLPRFQVDPVLRAIEEHHITDLNGVPPMIAMLMQDRGKLANTDLSSVGTVILNSAPASKDLLEDLTEVFDEPRFVFTFGTTESGPIAFTAPDDGRRVPLGSVGVPHPAVDIRLVESVVENGEETGVLQIRCGGLMTGYHNRTDIPSPITEDRFYHTKDVFRRDAEGFYFFVGREDDMFVSGGENLYPRAIELALETHPEISQAAVVPVPDKVKGAKPVAFVVRLAGATVGEQEIKEHALSKMEPAGHPRRVWFVDELPLAATNKLDKKALEKRALAELGIEP